MSVSRLMFPFESGAMVKRVFSRVSPGTESGHGRPRCQTLLNSTFSGSVSCVMLCFVSSVSSDMRRSRRPASSPNSVLSIDQISIASRR